MQTCIAFWVISHIVHVPFFQVSSMGITPFFVENVSELQLCAIKLVTAVRLHKNSVFI